jgi:hypothetical protein
MNASNPAPDPVLERQGKRMLFTGGAVARWAARHRLFA